MNFKIGGEAKCIRSHTFLLVLKGKKYNILGMKYLCTHYPLVLYVNHEESRLHKTTVCQH